MSDFINVIAREQHEGGLYLATYGFSGDAIESLTEVQRETIKLGVDEKVISLCRNFVRAESGIWSPPLAFLIYSLKEQLNRPFAEKLRTLSADVPQESVRSIFTYMKHRSIAQFVLEFKQSWLQS